MEKDLKLTPAQAQPSKDALARFGYTSSATTWYAWAMVESTTGVKRGDRLWQLGFGSGFKCGSAVWKARRNIHQTHSCCEGEMVSFGLPKLPGKHPIAVPASMSDATAREPIPPPLHPTERTADSPLEVDIYGGNVKTGYSSEASADRGTDNESSPALHKVGVVELGSSAAAILTAS